MWSWREWRRERQMRKQLDETLKTKKRQPFGSSSAGATTGSGAPGDGPAAAIAQTPSVALLVQVGQQLDRRAPITLSIVDRSGDLISYRAAWWQLAIRTDERHNVPPRSHFVRVDGLLSGKETGRTAVPSRAGIPAGALASVAHSDSVRDGKDDFLQRKPHIHVSKELLMQWTVGFSSVLWALKVVMTRQYPTLAPGLDIKVPTNYLTWIELLGVHIFLPRLALLSQISGLAAGYLFTVIPGTMKLLAKYELQVDRALRKQGIKLPVKHRWKLVIADFGHNIKATKWWPRFRKCKATGA